jgi:CheY-like chemotaxis protein
MGKHLRVLAIEDDPDLGVLYESFLEAEGHQVDVARTAPEALRKLERHPDVVLLDLMLPGMDGYDLMRAMQKRKDLSRIPVIVVSASVPPGRHHIPGANAVVHKPFEFDGLLRTIEGLSHQHAA